MYFGFMAEHEFESHYIYSGAAHDSIDQPMFKFRYKMLYFGALFLILY